MPRWMQQILGLKAELFSQEAEWSLRFAPPWSPALLWNLLIAAAIGLGVWAIYRKEKFTPWRRWTLAGLRVLLGLWLLVLLNRPNLTLTRQRVEPSVVAVLVDQSMSMGLADVGEQGESRLEAVRKLLGQTDQSLLDQLAKRHDVRLYGFDESPRQLPTTRPLAGWTATGRQSHIERALREVMAQLRGKRLAGVVLLSDGRQTPPAADSQTMDLLRREGVKIFPVAVGADRAPRNVELAAVSGEEAVFQGDLASFTATINTGGLEPGTQLTVQLKDADSGAALAGPDGKAAVRQISVPPEGSVQTQIAFAPGQLGKMRVRLEVTPLAGEIDTRDNARVLPLEVLNSQLTILYVEGLPRWEYRYVKNEMMRDKSMRLSCLLTSADPNFAQEGTLPIRHFPETMEQLQEYDALVLGDVDPRQFTDGQLRLIADFVSQKGGGLEMVAGTHYSPWAWRNSAIEPLLPVSLVRPPEDVAAGTAEGFRPRLTAAGEASPIFRFFADPLQTKSYLAEKLPPLFWFCRGVEAKSGVGEVFAEHPTETGPDGHPAPLLVAGRYGAGRTLFSAIDDSWRWRFYTGESLFNTYWVQQLRYLARGHRMGQNRAALAVERPVYELGEMMRLTLRVLDGQLSGQLPDRLGVQLVDEHGAVINSATLRRGPEHPERYEVSVPAQQLGRFTAQVAGVDATNVLTAQVEVAAPRLEMRNPRPDIAWLEQLAQISGGRYFTLQQAGGSLVPAITSAAMIVPVESSTALWDTPAALLMIILLIGAEWIGRKRSGGV